MHGHWSAFQGRLCSPRACFRSPDTNGLLSQREIPENVRHVCCRSRRPLDRFQDVASVAHSTKGFAVISPCLRFLIIAVVSSLSIGPILAQEAVETAKPSLEASPEESPAKKEKDKNPDQSKPSRSLEETMRPEEFKAAGLDKLNENELQHLDAYLQGYRQAAQKKANDQAQAKANEQIKKAQTEAKTNEDNLGGRTKMDSLVSRVDGSIDGIKGHTVIRLEDGTVWKQVNVDDHYRATISDHPAAVVLHTTFGYKMRIEGMPEFYVDPMNKP
jgi:hypothetical protein